MWMSDPILGTGTGSYNSAFRIKRPAIYSITGGSKRNPHNEYLLVAVQLGLLGLLLLLYLFYTQLISSKKINDNETKYLSQGLVLLIVIGCLGNSLIMDSGEGHFWAFFSAVLFSNADKKIDLI
jgi:O-antigen ligase